MLLLRKTWAKEHNVGEEERVEALEVVLSKVGSTLKWHYLKYLEEFPEPIFLSMPIALDT